VRVHLISIIILYVVRRVRRSSSPLTIGKCARKSISLCTSRVLFNIGGVILLADVGGHGLCWPPRPHGVAPEEHLARHRLVGYGAACLSTILLRALFPVPQTLQLDASQKLGAQPGKRHVSYICDSII
jgi:hypothetical protein